MQQELYCLTCESRTEGERRQGRERLEVEVLNIGSECSERRRVFAVSPTLRLLMEFETIHQSSQRRSTRDAFSVSKDMSQPSFEFVDCRANVLFDCPTRLVQIFSIGQ